MNLELVYAQTNDARENRVVVLARTADGALVRVGTYATGGRGTGRARPVCDGSVVASADGRWLLVANAGSDDVSVFAIRRDGLTLVDCADARGKRPTSLTLRDDLVYVANAGGNHGAAAITGFVLRGDGRLAPLPGSTRLLSAADADPGEIAFSPDGLTLSVTERATGSISTFVVDESGYTAARSTRRAPTPTAA